MASDGGSVAVITRGDLANHPSWQSTVGGVTRSYSYSLDAKSRPPERFQLNPSQSMKARISFEIPPGNISLCSAMGAEFTRKGLWLVMRFHLT